MGSQRNKKSHDQLGKVKTILEIIALIAGIAVAIKELFTG